MNNNFNYATEQQNLIMFSVSNTPYINLIKYNGTN